MTFMFASVSLTALADTQRFAVVGSDVIFALSEPSGWKMDADGGRQNNNLPVVYYPAGMAFSNAPAVMYANTESNDCVSGFEKFINEDLEGFKNDSPGIVITNGGTMTVDGMQVVIKIFNGDRYGNSEAVAYINNKNGPFISITLTSRTKALYDQYLPVFKKLVSSIQLVGNAATCNGKLPSFKSRVDFANKAEKQPEIRDYLKNKVYHEIGSQLATIMTDCLAKPKASTDKFTLVANIKNPGHFADVDYQPKSNTASCFAKGLSLLSFPDTDLCSCGAIPFVIDMSIKE